MMIKTSRRVQIFSYGHSVKLGCHYGPNHNNNNMRKHRETHLVIRKCD